MRTEIPQEASRILERLHERGYEAYIVGGCVRDMMLGRQPEDWDITTNALPGQVKAVFGRTIDTGIKHGTVTVMMKGRGFEVTTYRIDGAYSDGRHPDSVAFTPSLEEDLKRRDFTINAMAFNRSEGLVDLFEGREDLRRGIIRCVGNPMERFEEDALRILRAIRFSAQLGFAIEEETGRAIRTLAPTLEKVSRERVQTELTKLLLSAHPEQIQLVYEMGAAPFVSQAFLQAGMPGTLSTPPDTLGHRIPHSVPMVKHLRWAAFLAPAGPALAVQVLKGLKMDNDTTNRVRVLTEHLGRPAIPAGVRESRETEKTALRRLLNALGPELLSDLLTLKRCFAGEADCGEAENIWPEGIAQEETAYLQHVQSLTEEILESGDCFSLRSLAVTGNDVIQAGVTPGREVGHVLSRLLNLVLEDPARNEKKWLLEHIGDCSSKKKEL